MEVLCGFPLFLLQWSALMRKNAILAWKNRKSTFVHLLSPLFFLSLIFLLGKWMELPPEDTPPLVAPPIRPCEDKFFVKNPCYDFVWSGNTSARAHRIVSAIMKNNPGRAISSDKVKSFNTPPEVDIWLQTHPQHCPGALHFMERKSTVMSYGIQTNSTSSPRGGLKEDPTFKFQIPLQIAAEREIARSLLGDDPKFNWVAALKTYALPEAAEHKANIIGAFGPTFFLVTATFGFVFQVSSLVTEKELKLRQAMSTMGLYDSAYWLSWLLWETLLTLLTALFTVLYGMMFQFDFFLHNNFAILFLTFFLFQLNMLAFSFTMSAFIAKSSSVSTVGFLIFLIGSVTQKFLPSIIYVEGSKKYYTILGSLFPPNLFGEAINMLSSATSTPESPGISWSLRSKCSPDQPQCMLTIEVVFLCFAATFLFWFILAIYLDNIIPNSNGVRKSVFYFLKPSYWSGEGGNKAEEGSLCSCMGIPPPDDVAPDDEDVLTEETTVKRQVAENETDPTVAIQIRGLAKAYPGSMSIGCCSCTMSPPFHAVKGVWMNLQKNQLFCLLGPNGAGKTTTISCLTGITPVTGGDALIYGHSVRSSVGMSNIRRMMGVCPQFDILWDHLSAEEHLHLFASIKGLPPSMIDAEAKKLIEEVKLTKAAKFRAGSYSGGMKRRLSVAVALIGDPKVVFLDEPTTGMDPLTRRNVWDIIEEAKKGRAIILTTHSMEEADILSDRIGIMAKGRLRCIGTSLRLKSRFGAGYVVNLSLRGNTQGEDPDANEEIIASQSERVKQLFRYHLDLEPKEETNKFFTFLIPREKEGLLMNFFAELEEREEELGISDIQLGLTTLEEVFLNIAKREELENTDTGGNLVPLTLTSGESVQVPVGARFVGIPKTESSENPRGLMVEIFWEQDDTGSLCIVDHSSLTPIPPHVQPIATHPCGAAQIVGFAIDPDQITSLR